MGKCNSNKFSLKTKEREYCRLVGSAIKQLRQEKTGKSCLLFAYENEIPKSTLNRIELGQNEAQLITLKKIAEAFNMSLSELFMQIEKKIPDFKIFEDEHY